MSNYLKQGFFTLITTIALFLFVNQSVLAAPVNPVCEPEKGMWGKIVDVFKALDIRRTVNNMVASAITDVPLNVSVQMTPTEMTQCSLFLIGSGYVNSGYPSPGDYTDITDPINVACTGVPAVDEDKCLQLITNYDKNAFLNGENFNANANQRVSGSLLGVANYLDGSARNEPVPLNMAYFWNDSIKEVPFAGQALAAPVSYGPFTPYLSVVLDIWKVFRNIAYGMLAAIMIIIGFMIMLKKKLPAQVTVSAQYALPRVVLAVILITFSYPIGAFMAASMKYMTTLLAGVLCQGAGVPTCPTPIGLLVSLVYTVGAASVGIGMFSLGILAISVLIILVLYIIALVVGFLEYFKLIFSIVLSPIHFALAAVPGNEKSTEKWFRGALSHVIGFIAIYLYIDIVNIIIIKIIGAPLNPPATFGRMVGSTFGVLLTPILLVWGYMQAIKVPKKVRATIMGDTGPKKR